MSEATTVTEVTAGYAEKVGEDLAVTKSEQERVRAELNRLQDQLRRLEESEQVLVKLRDVLSSTGTPTPASAQGKERKKASVPAARRRQNVPEQQKVSNKAKPSKATASAKGAGQETWATLVDGYLAGQSEPKSAAEVSAALSEAHPQRKVQTTVVRNTLEQRVARGLLERSKQGRSVYYSPVAAPAADASATSAE
ncbi:hypothetical protein ACFVW8_38910 [Streptomyces sp. NPDC058221]|uniref:hypothetical protein n=1 Tax=Streptomyces sp. NPDC058221 TaxID=3346388 RepID=UPI0036DFE9FF